MALAQKFMKDLPRQKNIRRGHCRTLLLFGTCASRHGSAHQATGMCCRLGADAGISWEFWLQKSKQLRDVMGQMGQMALVWFSTGSKI